MSENVSSMPGSISAPPNLAKKQEKTGDASIGLRRIVGISFHKTRPMANAQSKAKPQATAEEKKFCLVEHQIATEIEEEEEYNEDESEDEQSFQDPTIGDIEESRIIVEAGGRSQTEDSVADIYDDDAESEDQPKKCQIQL
ncbi:hypothetical protein OUZ56_021831 [Daphnia magna]|uniref:Uncharacterized protein n=1 Tax=Daphnia magna TaxID=35525 RepID=A0ABR0AUL0_9CRUS|nr:hypothetical protein OUZ56_021831 [Daphnia magna]